MRGELISIDVIKHELAKRLDSLVLQLYPLARLDSSKHNFCLGSLSGEAGQSLRIARTSTKLGWRKDFSSGADGRQRATDLVRHPLESTANLGKML